ncbi:androgen-binding protein homolog [Cricetulus griseus]|uniref:Androgen-binding protein homolog n=1 Tax=Cricetulus griseus TaxID=10029 RepID=A0A9J7H7N6_CRIGR|nr:androgen-binding protein homolog [Cricetulus griseus]
MKGTLLLLALLVTGELGFQKTEACITYFETYATMLSGNKIIMNALISKFEPTAEERAAYEKIQECYNEAGVDGKTLDTLLLVTSSLPQTPCTHGTSDPYNQ